MKKSNIRVFGETSIAHVEKRGLFSYVVVRDCDKKVIAKSFSFRNYINDTIRTMYTGEYYATGDFILVADTVNGSKEIYRWKWNDDFKIKKGIFYVEKSYDSNSRKEYKHEKNH